MAGLRLSRVAQADFDAVIDYLTTVAGNRVAVAFAENVQASIDRLADFPGIGSPRPQFGAETRTVGVAPYLIFYDGGPKSETVHVLRILHGRRDITPGLIAAGRQPGC
jgi:toxin ParE1/3/4